MIDHTERVSTDRPKHLADHDIKDLMSCAHPDRAQLIGRIRLNQAGFVFIEGETLEALGRIAHIWAMLFGPRSIFLYIECDPTLPAGEPIKFRAFGNNPHARRLASSHTSSLEFDLYHQVDRMTTYFAVLL